MMLKPIKSKFIWCVSLRCVHLIDKSDVILKDGRVAVSNIVRNVDAFFDEFMSMNDHLNSLVTSCFFQLHRIKSIHQSLPIAITIQLVNSSVISRVVYCNSVWTGLHIYQLDRIQSVLNVTNKPISGREAYMTYAHVWRNRGRS